MLAERARLRISSREARSDSSASQRSVTSRRITVKKRCPFSAVCEIEASMGNSSPFLRRPITMRCLPMRRDVTPVSPKCFTWAACPARKRSGMNHSRGAPIACSRGQAKTASAAALNRTMWLRSSMVMMASMAESRMPRSRASLRAICSSACTRSVTSRRITVKSLWPSSVCCEIDASTGNSWPSARRPWSTQEPMPREVIAVFPKRSMCDRCAARKRSGRSMSSFLPRTASRGQRKTRSAAALNCTTRCSPSVVMMASMADSITPPMRATKFRAWRCAARRSSRWR